MLLQPLLIPVVEPAVLPFGEPCSVSDGDKAPLECNEPADECNDDVDTDEAAEDVDRRASEMFASVVRPQLRSTSSAKLPICVVKLSRLDALSSPAAPPAAGATC